MSGQSYLPEVVAALEKSGLVYRWTFCLLTTAGENAQVFDRHIIPKWKPVLWYTKGNCDHLSWTGDIIEADANDKRFHVWGQSVGQMEWIIKRASLPGQIILDPFCGGGTTGVAALQLQRMFIGVDIDRTAIAQTAERCKALLRIVAANLTPSCVLDDRPRGLHRARTLLVTKGSPKQIHADVHQIVRAPVGEHSVTPEEVH